MYCPSYDYHNRYCGKTKGKCVRREITGKRACPFYNAYWRRQEIIRKQEELAALILDEIRDTEAVLERMS